MSLIYHIYVTLADMSCFVAYSANHLKKLKCKPIKTRHVIGYIKISVKCSIILIFKSISYTEKNKIKSQG